MTSVRRFLWRAGAPARLLLLGAIWLYRVTLSGWLGGQCRFSPTCSHYAADAIRTHGAIVGDALGEPACVALQSFRARWAGPGPAIEAIV